MQSTFSKVPATLIAVFFLLSAVAASNSCFAEEDSSELAPNAYAEAAGSSFLWPIAQSAVADADKTDHLSNALSDLTSNGVSNVRNYGNALFVPLGVDAIESLIKEKNLVDIASNFNIEPNGVVHGFGSDCEDGPPYTPEYTSWGVVRVWGASVPLQYSGYVAVWIIDSGVANYDGSELNVVERLDCTRANCPTGPKKDKIGHGTMIAGIIGAQRNNAQGIYGIAPYVAIHALRVYRGKQALANLRDVKEAVDYLNGKTVTADNDPMTLSPGDVINLSLGAHWDPRTNSTQSDIENGLRALANNGLKISVAAGNVDVLNGLGYVQAISPARAGGYRAPTVVSGIIGGIWTASAINNSDDFWEFSAFGNFTQTVAGTVGEGPPDFAEPGQDIVSLWPGKELATCSGTSFAAAHLAGLLVYDEPKPNVRSKKDPSAEKPGYSPKQYESSLCDWVGTHY